MVSGAPVPVVLYALFLIDDSEVRVGGSSAWFFIAYEPLERKILGMWLSWTRNQLVVERFLRELVRRFGRHQVYTDGGSHYLAACKSLGLEHRVYRLGSWMKLRILFQEEEWIKNTLKRLV